MIWIKFIWHKLHRVDSADYISGVSILIAYLGYLSIPKYQVVVRRFIAGAIFLVVIILGFLVVGLYPRDSLIFAASLITWFFLGWFCLEWIVREPLESDELCVMVTALGMVLYSFIVLLLGLSGLLYPGCFAIVMALITGFGLAHFGPRLRALMKARKPGIVPFDALQSNLGMVLLLLAAACFLIFIISNLVPPWGVDDLLYHLQVPHRFAMAHRVYYLPDLVYSNYPFSEEMLYAHGMAWGSLYIYSGMTNVLFVSLLLAAYCLLGRRYFHPMSGILAFLFLFSIPYYIVHTYSGSVDLKFLLYCLLTAYAFLRWLKLRDMPSLRLCGLFAGCALNFRYQGLIVLALFSAAIGFCLVRDKKQDFTFAAEAFANFMIPALLIGFPWYLKNFLETGNPVFFTCFKWGHHYFGFLGDPEWSKSTQEFVGPNNPEAFGYEGFGTGWRNYLHLPWNLTFCGGAFEGYRFTPIYLALTPLAWLRVQKRETRWLLAFCFVYTTCWFFQLQELKFLMPAFGIYGLICADALLQWKPRWPVVPRNVLLLGCFYSIVISFALFYNRAFFTEVIPVAFRLKDAHAYRDTHAMEQPLINFTNASLARDARICSVCNEGLFYLERDYMTCTGILGPVDYRHCVTTLNFLARLRELGMTYVILPSKRNASPGRCLEPSDVAYFVFLRDVDSRYFHTLFDDGTQKVASIQYPPNLPPYNPREALDPVLIADMMLQSGNLNDAIDAYEQAASQGSGAAARTLASLQRMNHVQRGDFYFAKAKEFKTDRYFLKSALDEYEAARPSEANADVIQQRRNAAILYGKQIKGQHWYFLYG